MEVNGWPLNVAVNTKYGAAAAGDDDSTDDEILLFVFRFTTNPY